MPRKRHTLEEIVAKLRQVDVLSVAAHEPPICVWLPVGLPATKVHTVPFSVIVALLAGWLEKVILPSARLLVVIDAPKAPLSQ
jgi:hypothetical protein